MDSSWHPWNLIYLSPVVIGWYIALVFYLSGAQSILSRRPAESRMMSPRSVWLALIPVFGFVWVIFVSRSVSESLEKELHAKQVQSFSAPGRVFGVTAGSLFCVAAVFLALAIVASATGLSVDPAYSEFGGNDVADFAWMMWFLSGAAGVALWIVHWEQAFRVSSRLRQPWTWQSVPQPYAGAYAWPQPPCAEQAGPSGPGTAGPSGTQAPGPDSRGEFCSACGRYVPGTRYCPQCGKERRPA
jgi:hypothetical protein